MRPHTKNSYGKDVELVAEKVNGINIIHLHGQLGYLPWQCERTSDYNHRSREYIVQIDSINIKVGADNIKIIHEDIDNDKEFQKAYELLDNADRIFFLGFGFHPTNLKRLNITTFGKGKTVAGTSLGITDREKAVIESESKGLLGVNNLINTDIVNFFRSYHILD